MMAKHNPNTKDFIIVREGLKPWIVSSSKIKDLVRQRIILGDDLIYRESLVVWTKARHLKGLRRLIQRLEGGTKCDSNTSEQSLPDEDFISGLLEDTLPEKPTTTPVGDSHGIPEHIPPAPSTHEASVAVLDREISPRKFDGKVWENEESGKLGPKKVFIWALLLVMISLISYWNYPVGSSPIPVQEFIVGRVLLDKAPLPGGTVVVESQGKELATPISATGNYTLMNPPKGQMKFKVHGVAPPLEGPTLQAIARIPNGPIIPPKYLQYENGLSLNYQGGVAVHDLLLKEK